MAQVEYASALTTLEMVKNHALIKSEEYDAEITQMINQVTARIQTHLGRHVMSRQWVHDGSASDNARLDSTAGVWLFLPEMPITAVSTLKIYPTESALTEGYDEDFVVHAREEMIELVGGQSFYTGRQIVEITYTAGYLALADTTTGQESWIYGYDEASADIQRAATIQAAWMFHRKQRQREGVASISSEGVSVSYVGGSWDEEAFNILERHRVRMPSLL